MEARKRAEIEMSKISEELKNVYAEYEEKLTVMHSQLDNIFQNVLDENLYIPFPEFIYYLKENRPSVTFVKDEIPESGNFSNCVIFFENEDGTRDFSIIADTLHVVYENMKVISIEDEKDGYILHYSLRSDTYKWDCAGAGETGTTVKILGFF